MKILKLIVKMILEFLQIRWSQMIKKVHLVKVYYLSIKEGEKCPPWTLQASKMTHNNKNKTIYYDNYFKIYDIPIFYFPFLSHPDPTVDRRSGLLTPSFSDSKNLGAELKFLILGSIEIKI